MGYSCEFCQVSFDLEKQLKRHQKISKYCRKIQGTQRGSENLSGKYRCKRCMVECSDLLCLELHETRHKLSDMEKAMKEKDGEIAYYESWLSQCKKSGDLPADYKDLNYDRKYYRIVDKYLRKLDLVRIRDMREKLWDHDYILCNLTELQDIDLDDPVFSQNITKIRTMVNSYDSSFGDFFKKEDRDYIDTMGNIGACT